MISLIVVAVVVVFVLLVVSRSFRVIGPSEIGLVTKRFGKRLNEGQVLAFRGEAGYQARLLMPGLRFKPWPVFGITKYPWVQVPAGEIGVTVSQLGAPMPTGAKSAAYNPIFGNYTDLDVFMSNGGQKGVQRQVLTPGTLAPIHPVAFLVLTEGRVFGLPVTERGRGKNLSPADFGLREGSLRPVIIEPRVSDPSQGSKDVVGIVTTLDGPPLPSGDIASRLGGWADVAAMEGREAGDAEIIELLLGSKNILHNNYQDFQAFIDNGGCIGLQHDPLLYGSYLLNPFLVQVQLVDMLVVRQGEVAVVKSYVGLPTIDTSGEEFKFGSIVTPGHRGIWQEPLRTGKFAINPRVYAAEVVPTSILTLNWANVVSEAHNLDAQLSPIDAKSREGFIFNIDLQVQIHVPDTHAPKVISMVGTMANLVNEVLQSAVGNYFRNALQGLPAVKFIETRDEVQQSAQTYIQGYLAKYEVETRGVYIQDVVFPTALVEVLTSREIANQEKATFEEQQRAQVVRIDLEKARGTADMQASLASATVDVDIQKAKAEAKAAQADGLGRYTERTGSADAVKVKAVGLAEAAAIEAQGVARAVGYLKQVEALGTAPTAAIAVAGAISEGHIQIVPEVLVEGGAGGSALTGLAGVLMGSLRDWKPGGEPMAVGVVAGPSDDLGGDPDDEADAAVVGDALAGAEAGSEPPSA